MAAAEYYGTASTHELPGSRPPHVYPPQPQPKPAQYQQPQPFPHPHFNNDPSSYPNIPPPSYANFANPSQQQLQTYQPPPTPQQFSAPGGLKPPPYPTGPAPTNADAYLSAPLQPIRSHSQPPRVHFADQESDDSSSDTASDSSNSPRRRRKHRRHRSYDDRDVHHSRDDRDIDRGHHSRDDRGHHSHTVSSTRAHRKERKDRDTFLGAGAGALVGDVIFPGLGTAAGILLGGLGGRKYARSKSEGAYDREGHTEMDAGRRHRHRHGEYDDSESGSDYGRRHRRRGEKGWDEKSATYKSGSAVR